MAIPSLRARTKAVTMYNRLNNVENASHTRSADKWGTAIAKRIHAKPEIAMKCGSFNPESSWKRT